MTIDDVAKRAGVSTATVSRYMAGERIKAESAVREAIAALDYEPASAARTLRSGVNHVIAVVIPDITNPFFSSVLKGVEAAIRETPYSAFLLNTDESVQQETNVISKIARRVDGVILAPVIEQEILPQPLVDGLPTVFIDRNVSSGGNFASVLVDNAPGTEQAVAHLVALGHRDIAMISGPLATTPGRERYDGFAKALQDAAIPEQSSYVRFADFHEQSGYRETAELLAQDRPPTAIFSANNLMTIGVLRALRDSNVRIPDDVSVIGFDDFALASLLQPPLTVVERSAEEQGRLAAELLMKRLVGNRTHDDTPRLVLPTQLIERSSCASPRSAAKIMRIAINREDS